MRRHYVFQANGKDTCDGIEQRGAQISCNACLCKPWQSARGAVQVGMAFKTDDGIEKFVVEASDAARMFAGATGMLKYRGTHFIAFVVD